MAIQWLRRAQMLAACAFGLLLAGCGSSSIESQLHPTRVIAFGDAMADLGQNSTPPATSSECLTVRCRYTINDGSVNIWTQQLAGSFGLPLASNTAGGLSYAVGNARAEIKPDAAGNSNTLTVKEQIDLFLASNSFAEGDLVLVSAGTADVVAEAARAIAGTQTQDQALANLGNAGQQLGGQVRRLVNAGAKHVVIVGTYNLGRSPWARATGQNSFLTSASTRFNEDMLVSIVDLGANVLYVDAAYYFNLVTGSPSGYSIANAADLACGDLAKDPGAGIGTGTDQVNSALCTPAELAPGATTTSHLFADRVYFTPQGHRLFGNYAFTRVRQRW